MGAELARLADQCIIVRGAEKWKTYNDLNGEVDFVGDISILQIRGLPPGKLAFIDSLKFCIIKADHQRAYIARGHRGSIDSKWKAIDDYMKFFNASAHPEILHIIFIPLPPERNMRVTQEPRSRPNVEARHPQSPKGSHHEAGWGPGLRVRLFGLANRKELNGNFGIIINMNSKPGLHTVQLDNGQVVNVPHRYLEPQNKQNKGPKFKKGDRLLRKGKLCVVVEAWREAEENNYIVKMIDENRSVETVEGRLSKPICVKGHTMEVTRGRPRLPDGRLYGGVVCDACLCEDLQLKGDFLHCPHCVEDYCMDCATNKSPAERKAMIQKRKLKEEQERKRREEMQRRRSSNNSIADLLQHIAEEARAEKLAEERQRKARQESVRRAQEENKRFRKEQERLRREEEQKEREAEERKRIQQEEKLKRAELERKKRQQKENERLREIERLKNELDQCKKRENRLKVSGFTQNGISQEVASKLIEQGFESLEDLKLLDDKTMKQELQLALRDRLHLKKIIQRLQPKQESSEYHIHANGGIVSFGGDVNSKKNIMTSPVTSVEDGGLSEELDDFDLD